jgi:hypothetical protein
MALSTANNFFISISSKFKLTIRSLNSDTLTPPSIPFWVWVCSFQPNQWPPTFQVFDLLTTFLSHADLIEIQTQYDMPTKI